MVVGAKSHRGDPQDVNFYALCFFVSSGLESLEGFRCHVECLKKDVIKPTKMDFLQCSWDFFLHFAKAVLQETVEIMSEKPLEYEDAIPIGLKKKNL